MPDFSFDSLDAIPEALRAEAKQDEATKKYSINLVSNKALTEFRDNNIKLSRSNEEFIAKQSKYVGIVGDDAEKFAEELKALRETSALVKDGKLKTSDDIAKALATQTADMRAGHEAALKALTAAKDAETGLKNDYANKYKGTVRDNAITQTVLASDSGVNPAALADIIARARDVFEVDEKGRLTAKVDGDILYGADGSTPMSPKEWVAKLLTTHQHYAKASVGGGAVGGGAGAAKYGMSEEAFFKLPAEQRLAWANKQGAGRK